jgi:hypothetical protein
VLLIVWIAVVVLALLVLGGVAFGLFGAFARLGREVTSFEREVRPVLDQVQAAAAAAEARREQDEPRRERDDDAR